MLNDPIYTELIAYYQGGGVTAVNVNATAFDSLCTALTGGPASRLPAANTVNMTATQTALVNIYSMMNNYMTNLTAMYQFVSDVVNLLSPTDITITNAAVETACLEVLLPDFTSSYITPWIAITTPSIDPTLVTSMQTFYASQVSNYAAYQAKLAAAQSALNAMSNASNPSMLAMMPAILQTILAKMAPMAMTFGTIGKSPGQEYKDSQQPATPTPAVPPTVNQGSPAPAVFTLPTPSTNTATTTSIGAPASLMRVP